MQPRSITDIGPTPENGCEGASFEIRIYNFLKAAKLMRLMAAPLSIKMWYNLMLVMAEEMSSGSYPTPAIFLGQSEVSKPINISIHLWCGAALGAGTVTATARCRVLMTRGM
jgi:hypothetical protein